MRTAPNPNPEPSVNHEPGRSQGRWVKIVSWIVGSLAVLVLLIVVAGAILLHSARFHHYLLTLAETKASDALGTQVHIENFALHLSNLSLDVYGITVSGAEPYPNPPLLLVHHAEVGIRVVSIWHREWYLDSIRIDQPVARIFTAADGTSNIPKPKSSGGSGTNVFKLGIRHAVLADGAIYYNDKKAALNADLHDVDLRSSFDSPQ